METPLDKDVILCFDGHVIYKGCANDNHPSHVVLRDGIKQRVKQESFHIQHVDSLYNRLKIWIASTFLGILYEIPTEFLNRFKAVITVLKKEANHVNALLRLLMMESNALFATQ